MTEAILDKIRNDILGELQLKFENVRITEVNLAPDVDYEGDEILRIEVIFEGTPRDIDPGLLTRAARSIRPKLLESDLFAFPLMTFTSAEDAKLRLGT
ncbi:MAG: hypothetical protein KDJ48_08995 [Nitratireductor sp.]|nr:hypothetical protein [Nitratireductor sp.]MCB1455060.1 hypothetical protein [Nitratireductor sp.]MCB1459383.1 hypothetical protein [Nitratireductor sp.]